MEEALYKYAKLRSEGRDESHDIFHLERVKNYALQIANHEHLDDETKREIYAAALLHDLPDHKYVKNLEEMLTEMRDKLNEHFSPDATERILLVINNISYSKEKKDGYPNIPEELRLMRDIVSDADKIDALGKMGLKRCDTYTREQNPHLSDEDISNLVLQHCHDKLLHLRPKYIRTEYGQILSQKGHEEIEEYVEQKN